VSANWTDLKKLFRSTVPLLQYFGPNTTVFGPGCTLFFKISLGVKPELMATHPLTVKY